MSDSDRFSEPVPVVVDKETAEAPSDLDQVRQLILASHTDVVPELVQGDSITDLVASIEPAREAYTRIVDSRPQPVTIPAGGNAPVGIDIDTLPTSEKLRRGLAGTNRS